MTISMDFIYDYESMAKTQLRVFVGVIKMQFILKECQKERN